MCLLFVGTHHRGAGKLGRSKLGLGKVSLCKLASSKVGRWLCAESVNSVETLSD